MKILLTATMVALTLVLNGCSGGGGGSSSTPVSNTGDVTITTNTVTGIGEAVTNGVQLSMIVDTVDSDNDGMVDSAEVKYGFDPFDAGSFPEVPELVTPTVIEQTPIADSGVGAYIEVTERGIVIKWDLPEGYNYTLTLDNSADNLYYGGHNIDSADIDYTNFNLAGDEILTGNFTISDSTTGNTIEDKGMFTINLSDFVITKTVIGKADNRISFTYKDFDPENEVIYTNFLKKVWPIMIDRMGPPAESFNCVITNMGPDSEYFMITDDGRTFLSTQRFLPRLIVHEFIHAWKGKYLITADANWGYDTDLSGFEEGLAEGLAFEIMHEFVKAFPNDSATTLLLDNKPYQYHSAYASHLDVIKLQKNTGAGSFWTTTGSYIYRYNVAAVTVQNILKEYPDFYKDTQAIFYANVTDDNTWRPTRANVLDIWSTVAPTVQGIDLTKYINALPVFKGNDLEDGFYIQNSIKQNGNGGSQQFSIAYAVDGYEWWNVRHEDIDSKNVPASVNYHLGDDGWVYPDMQGQQYTYNVYTDNQSVISSTGLTSAEYAVDGKPVSLGWDTPTDIQQANVNIGLYRSEVTFTNFQEYNGTSESFYFFGYSDYVIEDSDTVLMVGIDTIATDLNISVEIDGLVSTTKVNNSLGLFGFTNEIPKGYEAMINITVNNENDTCEYKRSLLDSYTQTGKSEFGYVIIDKDFNCIEDIYE
jgi:hypothetical protein